ncbi:MAG TPA: fatty acid desaturase [Gemmatimonadaceae bacterium]
MSQDGTEAEVTHTSGDASTAFLKRGALVDSAGLSFRDFRRTLTPRFGVVWSQLILGYVALVVVGIGVGASAPLGFSWLRVTLGAVLFGFFQAYIQLFFHEAAHYNVAPGRERNDRLANVFIGALHGLEIQTYRLVHFEHHRRLGTAMDSERSYFDPLNMRFFAEALLGIKGLRVLSRRDDLVALTRLAPVAAQRRQRVVAAVLNVAIVCLAWVSGQRAVALAWIIGTLSVMPLFVSLRQVLEHRSEGADATADYSRVDHGAVNRLFGEGPIASTLGAAGFNRHMLHHWEPQISYTRLGDVERYLMRTDAAAPLERHRSTYWETFRALVTW